MKEMNLRTFVQRCSLLAGAAIAVALHARVLGANEDLRLATIGFHGQGGLHIRLLRELPGVRVVALCDPDRSVLDGGRRQAEKLGQKVDT